MLPSSPLVAVEWLFNNANNPLLVIIDATLAKPVAGGAVPVVQNEKIPNSIFLDIEKDFSDTASNLPHMMLSAEAFTNAAQQLGIDKDSIIIVYDTLGVYSAPRAWWMFRTMGHKNVFVLNGGLPEWKKAGYPTVTAHASPAKKGNFAAHYQPRLITDATAVALALQDEGEVVIDARSPQRFAGNVAEPREGLRRGHMPNAKNIYFEAVLNGNVLLDEAALEKLFAPLATKEQRIIFSCGSGITACITALAATIAGYTNISVYDGSWCQWGLPSELPVTDEV